MINTNNITIQIFNNANSRHTMKVHYLKKETDRRKFLQMCSDVLSIKAQRIFDQHGKEIFDIKSIQMGGSYFISSGEDFNNYNSNFQNSFTEQKQLIQYRISLLGMGSVGKSNLTTRWVNNEFFEDYSRTLLDKYTKKVTIGEQLCQVEISDTCGQEEYISLRTQWMKDKEGLIFTYAINEPKSFEDITNTLQLFQQMYEKQENIPAIVLVGNKSDLENERKVSTEEGKMLANQYRGLFFETSAKNGTNVNQMFTGLLNEIVLQKEQSRKQQFQNLNQEVLNAKPGWCQLI